MKNTKSELQYKRMYETKNVRPYYTIPHLGVFGTAFKKLVGFEYKHSIYITSQEMNNEGYHEVGEMAEATEHFRKLWNDEVKVKELLKNIKDTFQEAVSAEEYGWKQDWKEKDTKILIEEMDKFFNLLFKVFTRMVLSQPQHVLSLDQNINTLLEKYSNRDQLLPASTYFVGDLPWVEEDKKIEELNKTWKNLDEAKQNVELDKLVEEYGWFNEIEGDRPFNQQHYKEKIISFKKENKPDFSIDIPEEIKKAGQLIGELGFLRFWNRYHFMTIRYHLKKILTELTERSGKNDLEFATVAEVNSFFDGKEIDWNEIRARKNGYASHLENGETKIVTGNKADELKELVREDTTDVKEIKGNIANKGKVTGIVRIISFTAKDYSEQVAAFKDREILVTGMTRPQIVHLCKKAAAIVTDEGGITSHAAVVSREFGIPCIIATHNATRILKTGDLVEVDADQGVVRKITN